MNLINTDFKLFTKHLSSVSALEYLIEILPKCTVDGPWIAGGCLHRTYRNLPLIEADIDVFFKNKEQLDKFLLDLNAGALNTNKYKTTSLVVSEWHHTICVNYMDREWKIQCVSFKYFNTIEELFNSFDINLCRIAYDGKNIISEHNVFDQIKDKKLKFDKNSIHYPSVTLKRLVKYVKMGYNVEDEDLRILTYAFFNSKKKAIDVLDQDISTKKPTPINNYDGLK